MSLIFEETKTLTPNDTKTNVPLQFYVAEELEKMKIEFSYSPKNLDDEEKAHKYIDDGFEKYAPEPYRKGYKLGTNTCRLKICSRYRLTARTAISAALTGRTAAKRTLFRKRKALADL